MGYATLGRRREDCRFMIVNFRVKGFRCQGRKTNEKLPGTVPGTGRTGGEWSIE
jgi:hypothetical protein